MSMEKILEKLVTYLPELRDRSIPSFSKDTKLKSDLAILVAELQLYLGESPPRIVAIPHDKARSSVWATRSHGGVFTFHFDRTIPDGTIEIRGFCGKTLIRLVNVATKETTESPK